MNAIWTGKSGIKYTYTVYQIPTTWHDVPGNYIFASIVGDRWKSLYVGQTGSFKDRFADHETWPDARKLGATHVHARVNRGGELQRKAEELDLIQSTRPPCNVQVATARSDRARRAHRGTSRCARLSQLEFFPQEAAIKVRAY